MSGLGNRAIILSLSRLANYGLMIISPVILARILPVADFGRYREFLLYASIVQALAAFSINDSLLYLMPHHPRSSRQIVDQTVLLSGICSAAVICMLLLVDQASAGAVFGSYTVPIICYVMLYVNFDFWESYWLAIHKPAAVFYYTVGRLTLRMLVVVGVALASRDVDKIIWALILLEGVRMLIAAFVWRRLPDSANAERTPRLWSEQLQFCLPVGLAVVFSMVNRNIGNVAVAKVLGTVAFAHYTIGTYGDPIVVTLRNSISTVLLPEMVRRQTHSPGERLELWHRSIVVNCLLLFPAAAICAFFAEPLIVTAFGAAYRPAAPVLQLYAIIMIRECLDFSPPLRALNRTRPLLYSNVIAAIASLGALYILLERHGIEGAMLARVISGLVDVIYLGLSVAMVYRVGHAGVLPWGGILKAGMAALGCSPVLWLLPAGQHGIAGVVAVSILYCGCFIALALALRIGEARMLWGRITQAFRAAARSRLRML